MARSKVPPCMERGALDQRPAFAHRSNPTRPATRPPLPDAPALAVASGRAQANEESGMAAGQENALDHIVVLMFENRSFDFVP
jgi:phospholipase C